MKKKILAAILALLASHSSQAGDLCDKLSHSPARFYLGPSLAVEQTSASFSRYRGFHPMMNLGYLDMSNKYMFAGEISVTPFTINLSDARYEGGRSAKDSSSIAAALMPGALFYHDYWGYARLGVVTTRFTTPKASQIGIQMGLGLLHDLTGQWMIRADYIFTTYNSVSQLGNPSSNQIGVGLMYVIDKQEA